MNKKMSKVYFIAEQERLTKIIQDTYDDVFPEEYGRVGTTEDIYKIREDYSNKREELRKEFFKYYIVVSCEISFDETITNWKKLDYSDFTVGGTYLFINRKHEHILDAWLKDNNVEINWKSNGIDSTDMSEPCEDFINTYCEDIDYELVEHKCNCRSWITQDNGEQYCTNCGSIGLNHY